MYRVFLVPTDELAPKEVWLNAQNVVDCGEFWDFLEGTRHLVRRLAKTTVKSFEITPVVNRVVVQDSNVFSTDHLRTYSRVSEESWTMTLGLALNGAYRLMR